MIENWEQYKDLEYYPDRVCACGCGGRIKVKPYHSWGGIPIFIHNHHAKGDKNPMKRIEVIEKGIKTRKENGKTWCSKETAQKIQDWEQYKDLEFYSDHFCENCGGQIKVKSYHKYYGIPKYCCSGHASKGKPSSRKGKTWEEIYGVEKAQAMKQNQCEKQTGRKHSVAANEKSSKTHKQLGKNPEYREKRRKAQKQRWANPEYREKQLKAIFRSHNLQPNNPEKFLTKLLQKLFPNQWKYIGDGKRIVAGKCPDFIHVNQKKIIEHFGDYHHGEKKTGIPNKQHEQERIDCFAKEGYQTLIIWEHELEDEQQLVERLFEFSG